MFIVSWLMYYTDEHTSLMLVVYSTLEEHTLMSDNGHKLILHILYNVCIKIPKTCITPTPCDVE